MKAGDRRADLRIARKRLPVQLRRLQHLSHVPLPGCQTPLHPHQSDQFQQSPRRVRSFVAVEVYVLQLNL